MMSRWTMLVLVTVLVIASGSMVGRPGMQAQAQQGTEGRQESQTSTSTELLQEVRALRVAIERLTVAGTRAQLILGRLQMQEARMSTLARQLHDTRGRLLEVQRDRQNTLAQITRISEKLDQLSVDDRRVVEDQIDDMKQNVKRIEQRERDLQAEDASVAQALSSEQTRWLEFNERLEELERTLVARKE